MVVHGGRHLETVGMTPKQRHSNMAVGRGEPRPPHGRHPPIRGVAHRQSTAVSHKRAVDGADGGPRDGHGRDLPDAWNRIKASLSVFQRREVKVLGFGVKACPRPQRMALRWCSVPFALVGANSKACGEASGVLFSGTPPCVGGGSPCCRGLLTALMCLPR